MENQKSEKGTIRAINPTEKVSDRFKKREFVVTVADNPQYPQPILFQMTQDKCDVLNQYKVGQSVQVFYNLKGREHDGPNGKRFFNSLECWKLVSLQDEHRAASQASQNYMSDNDDLPF